jgi:pimeloyl-ACP methyl ester carboxylesterase
MNHLIGGPRDRGLTISLVASAIFLSALVVGGCTVEPDGEIEWRLVSDGEVTLEVGVLGTGRHVIMLPSLGRGAEDFTVIAEAVSRAGFQVILPQPRGIGLSAGPVDSLTMHDLGEDIVTIVGYLDLPQPISIVGHAFGNRVARVVASNHPEMVDRVVLLAAGGMVPIPDDIRAALLSSFDMSQPEGERLDDIDLAFFAEGHSPDVWSDGWYPEVARYQIVANQTTPTTDWWAAGRSDLLVVQGMEDVIAPPENARLLAEEYGDRVKIYELDGSGHAMLPEQPERIVQAIIDYLR